MEKDGEPAVFATPYAEVAIFRALINNKGVNGSSESSFGLRGGQLNFFSSQNLLDQAKQKIGRVYVLDKQKFSKFTGMQCRSSESVLPIQIVEVTAKDLPNDIKILD